MRLFDADKVLNHLSKRFPDARYPILKCELLSYMVKPEDVIPHGEWEAEYYIVFGESMIGKDTQLKPIGCKCSLCGRASLYKTPYCPYCGAKMDKE